MTFPMVNPPSAHYAVSCLYDSLTCEYGNDVHSLTLAKKLFGRVLLKFSPKAPIDNQMNHQRMNAKRQETIAFPLCQCVYFFYPFMKKLEGSPRPQ